MTNAIPRNDDRSSGFRGAGPCFNFLGADSPANCRTDRQDLWHRFVGTNRSDPLYLQHRFPRAQAYASSSWEWEPKTGKVTYEGKDKDGKPVKVTYVRSQLNSQPANVKNEIDPGFMNDQYWLVFPFHVIWDTSANVEDKGKQKLPLGKGSADQVVVKYPSDVGYTPGDTWELFVGSDNRVEEFVYRRGGPKKPSLVIATWAGYKKAGPLLVSTEHRGTADGKPLRIFFSDVSVKLTGSDTWIKAQ